MNVYRIDQNKCLQHDSCITRNFREMSFGNWYQIWFSMLPSKHKLDHLRNKKYLLICPYCFYQTQPSNKQIVCFDF